MNETQLRLFIAEHLRLLTVIGIVIVGLIIATSVFNRYTLVYISTSGPALEQSKYDDPVLYKTIVGSHSRLSGPGLHLVHKEVENISATLGEYVAVEAPVTHPWYSFSAVNLEFVYDKNAEKIAYYDNTSSTSCGTYDKKSSVLRSYDCANPVSLSAYTKRDDKSWGSDVASGFSFQNKSVSPYRGGLLGIVGPQGDRRDTSVQYVDSSGAAHIYPLPKKLRSATPTTISIATNTLDSSDISYVVVGPDGTVYTAKLSGTQPSYSTVTAPDSYSVDTQSTSCTVRTSKAYCYRGVKIVGDRPDDIERTQEYISIINLDDGSLNDAKLEGHPVLHFLYATEDGSLYGRSFDSLIAFDKTTFGNYTYRTISQDVRAGYGGQDDSLYYIKRNSVYKLSSSTGVAQKLFYSRKVTPQSFVIDRSQVFVLGEIADSGSRTSHAYRITTIDHTSSSPRLIDQLPAKDLPSVTEQQYIGSDYHLTLAVAISKTSPTPVDQADFERKQQAVLKQLKSNNIPTDELEISFGY